MISRPEIARSTTTRANPNPPPISAPSYARHCPGARNATAIYEFTLATALATALLDLGGRRPGLSRLLLRRRDDPRLGCFSVGVELDEGQALLALGDLLLL